MTGRQRAAVIYDCLVPFTMGGGERVYHRMAELLVERGFDVDYITRTQWDARSAPQERFAVRGVWRGEIYDGLGVRRPAAALGFAIGVFLFLVRRRRSYAVIVASGLPVLTAIAAATALVGSRTPVVIDWLEVWSWRKWRDYSGPVAGTVAAVLQGIAARMSAFHSVNSFFTRDRLRRVRASIDPVVLSLVDLVGPSPRRAADEPPVALFVGRLIEDKRPALVPEIVAKARREVPGLRAVIVGDGPEREAVERAIEKAGVGDAVRAVGRVDEAVLRVLREGASVFLSPSIREGFGIAVAEAAAAGVPSIVVSHSDNAAVDLIEDGVNGFVTGIDATSIADGVVRAIRGGPALRESSAAWFDDARQQRGLSASIDALLRRVLRRPRRA